MAHVTAAAEFEGIHLIAQKGKSLLLVNNGETPYLVGLNKVEGSSSWVYPITRALLGFPQPAPEVISQYRGILSPGDFVELEPFSGHGVLQVQHLHPAELMLPLKMQMILGLPAMVAGYTSATLLAFIGSEALMPCFGHDELFELKNGQAVRSQQDKRPCPGCGQYHD